MTMATVPTVNFWPGKTASLYAIYWWWLCDVEQKNIYISVTFHDARSVKISVTTLYNSIQHDYKQSTDTCLDLPVETDINNMDLSVTTCNVTPILVPQWRHAVWKWNTGAALVAQCEQSRHEGGLGKSLESTKVSFRTPPPTSSVWRPLYVISPSPLKHPESAPAVYKAMMHRNETKNAKGKVAQNPELLHQSCL